MGATNDLAAENQPPEAKVTDFPILHLPKLQSSSNEGGAPAGMVGWWRHMTFVLSD